MTKPQGAVKNPFDLALRNLRRKTTLWGFVVQREEKTVEQSQHLLEQLRVCKGL